ncbi:MAG: site-2 protease family protein [Clostridia bacterium]|nr:site-2 protease family protein [Clostridia bacterium]
MLAHAWSVVWPILVAILFFGVIIMSHELGHFAFARLFKVRINEFSIGMGPAIFKKHKGETDYSIRLFPIGGYVAMEGEDSESPDENAFNAKPCWQRAIIILAGATVNIICGIIIMAIILATSDLIGTPTIVGFADNAASEAGGLRKGDQIVAIGNDKVYTEYDLSYLMMRDKDAVIDFVVKRDGELTNVKSVKFDTKETEGITTVVYDFAIVGIEPTLKSVTKYAFLDSFSIARIVWLSLYDIATMQFELNDLSGPIGTVDIIADTTTDAVSTMDFSRLLTIMALIALNIGVFNLIPFPALDGGRFLLIVIEGTTGKKLPTKVESAINNAGLALLLGLMLVVTVNDILKFF